MKKEQLKKDIHNRYAEEIRIVDFDRLPNSINMNEDILKFICHEHGVFESSPTKLLRSSNKLGCPKCNIYLREVTRAHNLLEKFKVEAPLKYNNRFTYDYSTFTAHRKPMRMFCPDHGEFWAEPTRHLHGLQCGGCKICSEKLRTRSKAISDTDWFKKAAEVHDNRYEYIKISKASSKINDRRTITYKCPKHGTITQKLKDHVLGSKGCWECGQLASAEKRLRSSQEVISEIEATFPGRLDFSKFEYLKVTESFTLICKEHNKEFQTCMDRIRKNKNFYQCPICSPRSDSFIQRHIADTLTEKGLEVIYNDRKILDGKEIDILLPELNLGIEYNGVFWHSEKYMKTISEAKWHKSQKQKDAAKKKIFVAHFNSTLNPEHIINYALFKAGRVPKIFARKTKLSWINKNTAEEFLDKYHLQGAATKCLSYGLFYNKELIGVASFSKASSERGNKDPNRWELRRMVFNHHVIGGASKLLKGFIRSNPQVTSIISYSDNRWFTGEVYRALGFTHTKDCPPDYAYTKGDSIFHKAQFKHSCMKTKQNFDYDPNLTEIQNCHNNGYYRIWDCGKKKWELNLGEKQNGIQEHQEYCSRTRDLGETLGISKKRRKKSIRINKRGLARPVQQEKRNQL